MQHSGEEEYIYSSIRVSSKYTSTLTLVMGYVAVNYTLKELTFQSVITNSKHRLV